MKPIIKFLLSSLLIITNTSTAFAQEPCKIPTKHGLYEVNIGLRHDDRNRIVIKKDGKTLIDQSAFNFALVDPSSPAPNLGYVGKKLPLFDLNGDGSKELIVRLWTGGAHCCYSYDIYSLEPSFKRIWHFDAGDGHMLTMKSNKGLPPDIPIEDATFRYYGPQVYELPVVILRWQNGKFGVVRSRMKTRLDRHSNEQRIAALKKDLQKGFTSTLYEYLLYLYYSGHAKEAIDLMSWSTTIDDATAPKGSTKESAQQFHAAFVQQLKQSPFFLQIKTLNNDKI